MEKYQESCKGRSLTNYVLASDCLKVWISELGATILRIQTKDREGNWIDVALSHEKLDDYPDYDSFLGAVVGRTCNRIGKGKFILNDTEYSLPINNGPNSHHGGGFNGFAMKVFNAVPLPDDSGVAFYVVSPDGDQGYPGNIMLMVVYRLTEDKLSIEYTAASDADTIANFTSHVYFNLSGHPVSIHDHILQIAADRFGPVDPDGMVTGELALVENSPFDFRNPKRVGDTLVLEEENEQLKLARGVDHPFALSKTKEQAILYCPETGIELKISTTLPYLHVYTSNWMEGESGRGGELLTRQCGIAFESELFPNDINLNPGSSATILRKGEVWNEKTEFQFGVRENESK